MKKILVTGATGEIGIELVPELRRLHGNDNVVAGIHRKEPPEEIKKGPYAKIDVTDYGEIERVIREYQITHIFHLSSVLSGTAEANPRLAFQVNIVGLDNVLEAARKNGVIQVVYPSSIAAFGPDTPRDNTPNDTIQRPTTFYGISKVFGELYGAIYARKYGLDVRGVRLPGIISPKKKPPEPPDGTTDAFPLMIWNAVIKGTYESYLSPDTRLPMMYLPDAINALIKLSEAPLNKLKH
ncbi:NAD-dependent epimerase/dehydratase family protein, partial [Candidatus Woesearchaeota archaeon]|nr:NAD-dependent epimerase/dehydratase family protein [Candidatus Woesearchaeota archaeon]